jgi:hypothetical protein
MRAPRPPFGVVGSVLALGACSSDDFLVVTVDARPAVHDARALSVSLSNAGTMRVDSFPLAEHAFPVTFSISAPGRTGDLAIAIDATDTAGLVVGQGSATTAIGGADAHITLEATDFVVNTEYANNQFPSSDFEAAGFQLAASPDGTWTAVFRDACTAEACNVFGRRFDGAGKPVATAIAASSNAFTLTTELTMPFSTPAIASNASTTIAVWDAYPLPGTANGVACRALDATGQPNAQQRSVASDNADVVSVAALANGTFVAVWNAALSGTEVVRSAIIQPDCTAPAGPQTVSAVTTGAFPHRSAVAGSADRVLFTWVLDGDLHARMALTSGAFATTDSILVAKTAAEQIAHARVAGLSDGSFVVATRSIQTDDAADPGRIELHRVTQAGKLAGPPALVTDRSASDAGGHESFGIAVRPDDTVMVAWHTCKSLDDPRMCDVSGRILRPTGEPVTDVFAIPTTTMGDQVLPSVVGLPDGFVAIWSDASAQPPDIVGTSVRARIVYPPDS